jgi:Zn-dependent metalloprotease
MRILLLSFFFVFVFNSSFGQNKFEKTYQKSDHQSTIEHTLRVDALQHFRDQSTTPTPFSGADYSVSTVLDLSNIQKPLKSIYDPSTGQLIAIKGTIPNIKKLNSHEARYMAYLNEVKDLLHIKNPAKQIQAISTSTDNKGRIHTKIDQLYKGVKVYGGEMTIHEGDGNIYMLQGKTVNVSNDINMDAKITSRKAIEIAQKQSKEYIPISAKIRSLMSGDQSKSSPLIYPKGDSHVLAWHVDILVNLGHRETIIINAVSGEVIEKFHTLCKIHNHSHSFMDGKVKSTGVAIGGARRDIDIFQCGSEYLLIDASKPMYKGNPQCADADALINGVIITLDAGNTSPESDAFNYVIGNSTVIDGWDDASAISAHINGGLAYEYFRTKFGRNSITGNGSNIVSFVNVSERNGEGMDNAFWNGEFIFYGNGDRAFTPLAGGLDVAGHEMAHGVIQTTANLEYRNESGALNEHYADVFGVLIENEDFRIGEDVANPEVFKSGTMRDMGNPNNGGTSLNDIGYQPAHVDDQFFGEDDNGGVHINSGIPNNAFFRLVTDESYGSDINERAAIAEQIWYKALRQYLRSTSNFADMRVATIQAASEDFGQTVATAVANAFDGVGITGNNVTQEAEDFEENPGDEFVVWSDVDLSQISINTGTGEAFGTISSTTHISRPSATDNGQFIIFVNQNKQIQAVEINWSAQEIVRDFVVTESGQYRNAVISRDGTKIAALTGDLNAGEFDNKLIVFDLVGNTSREFELFNPTFSEDNVSTEGVQFADVLEFDLSGENIIYDAFNQLSGALGQDLSYWDIGVINVWNNAENRYALGNIFKLFNGLPEDVSIGNPTFSKNSPNIIAFDFIEEGETAEDRSFSVLGVNRETGDINEIFENNTLGFPSYSLKDDKIIFSVENNSKEILAIRELSEDKISASGDAFIFIENADWGVYMGNGERNLSTATEEEIKIDGMLSIYPNPVSDILSIKVLDKSFSKGHVTLYNMQGQRIIGQSFDQIAVINTSQLVPGTYVVKYTVGKSNVFRKVVKL